MDDNYKTVRTLAAAGLYVTAGIATPFLLTAMLPTVPALAGVLALLSAGTISSPAFANAVGSMLSGIAGNLAADKILRLSDSNSKENEDLARALIQAYKGVLNEFVEKEAGAGNMSEMKEAAALILSFLPKKVQKERARALENLFPIEALKGKVLPKGKSAEEMILQFADEGNETSQEMILQDIKNTLRRWYDEASEKEKRSFYQRIKNGLISLNPWGNGKIIIVDTDLVVANLAEKIAERLPHYLQLVVKQASFSASWIAFQRSHLQRILHEIKSSERLSQEERQALTGLKDNLENMLGNDDAVKLFAQTSADVIARINESETEIKRFVMEAQRPLMGLVLEMNEALKKLVEVFGRGLPPALPNFVPTLTCLGRNDILAGLSKELGGNRKTVVLWGMGGLGKSTVACKLAELVKGNFQARIYIDLGGFTRPKKASEVLLDAFQCFYKEAKPPAVPLPAIDGEGLSENEKRELENKREEEWEKQKIAALSPGLGTLLENYATLIVLDNATTEEQIEPFRDKAVTVIVTSRNNLDIVGASITKLGVMSAEGAREVLFYYRDKPIKDAPSEDLALVDKIAKSCDYLPIALEITGKILRREKRLDLNHFVNRFAAERVSYLEEFKKKWQEMARKDPEAFDKKNKEAREYLNITVSFRLSYDNLNAESLKLVWRRLAVPRRTFNAEMAAALSLRPLELVKDYMKILSESSLIEEVENGEKWKLHDLMRDFASDCLETEPNMIETEPNSEGSFLKVLHKRAADFYAGVRKPEIEWRLIEDLTPQFEEIHHRMQAEQYVEAAGILNGTGFDKRLDIWGYNNRLVTLYKPLVGKIQNPELESLNSSNLGLALYSLGDYDKAVKYCESALAISRAIADEELEARFLGDAGIVYTDMGRFSTARQYHEQALDYHTKIADKDPIDSNLIWKGRDLGNLGLAYQGLGQFDKALKFHSDALELSTVLKIEEYQTDDLVSLGGVYLQLGELDKAEEMYRRVIEIVRRSPDRENEANCREGVGTVHYFRGEYEAARKSYEAAIDISREINFRPGEASQLYRLGILFLQSRDWPAARKSFQDVLEFKFQTLDYVCRMKLGVASLGENKAGEAHDFFKVTREKCESILETSDAWLPRYCLAFALLAMNEKSRSLQAYADAVKANAARGSLQENLRNLQLLKTVKPDVDGINQVIEMFENKMR